MGGRNTKVPVELLSEWNRFCERRREEGATLWCIATELARDSGYSPQTIYHYINPLARLAHRRANLESSRRRLEKMAKERAYLRNYRRLTRHPERYLPQIFVNTSEKTLEAIANHLPEFCEGAKFPLKAVELILRQYSLAQKEGRIRGPPYLEESSPGIWSYSPDQPNY